MTPPDTTVVISPVSSYETVHRKHMEWYLVAAAALIGCGIVFLIAEFFLPTGGIVVVGALASFAIAVGIVFNYGTMAEGVATTIAVSIGLPVAGVAMFYGYQRLALKSGLDSETRTSTIADDPMIAGLEKFRGRYGRTVSTMRPAGVVEIDGRRVDAMSEGLMIDEGQWIRCVDVRAGKVIVRQATGPGDLENLDLGDLQS